MRVNEYFDRVVVINLDRRTDRMAKLGAQLDELRIVYERFSAVDAQEVKIDPKIAGVQSHVAVWKRYLGKKVLILEDDALFCQDFNEKFDEHIAELPKNWDIFYLGVLLPKNVGKVEPVNRYWSRLVFSTGSHAYCIKPELMYTYIKALEDYDWYIDVGLRVHSEDRNIYVPESNLVTQFPSFSDLRGKEVDDF